MRYRCRFFVLARVLSSLFCYASVKMMLFWFFYELSILCLLYLLAVESPYSERYLASWYLGGYVVLTRLPMLLCVIYLGGWRGEFFLSFIGGSFEWGRFFCLIVLCVSFITKIPLFPFHSWLPVVHAEASSPVSVCLRGFIMKLGVLGVFRFGFYFLPEFVFSYSYVLIVLIFRVFVFLFSCQELDGKRWLAFLRLSHIVFCAVGLRLVRFESLLGLFLFCLGHGVSAGLTFLYLWLFYGISGSRKWMILKSGAGSGFIFRSLSF